MLLSIPLSALATFVVLALMGSTINTMILGGLALAFSRVIDNSVISLENIYRHLEMGALPRVAAEVGGAEVSLAVLAATLVDVVDFFPVTSSTASASSCFPRWPWRFALSLLASFVVAMTVIPLFCSRFLKQHAPAEGGAEHPVRGASRAASRLGSRFNAGFNRGFSKVLDFYERWVRRALVRPGLTVAALAGVFVLSLGIYPFLRRRVLSADRRRAVHHQHESPTGTRIEVTEQYVAKVEDLIRQVVTPARFQNGGFEHRRGERFLGALHH